MSKIVLSARADLQSDSSEYKHLKCNLRTAARPPFACYRKDSKWRHVTHPSPCHYCKQNKVSILLVSELSRLGRNAFEVLATVKDLIDSGINLYLQKEQLTLLDGDGKPTLFAPIMIATLSTCAQLERENIKFRLNSGRKLYIERGGKLGRKVGSTKTIEQKKEQYKDVISYLKRGYSVRTIAKLTNKGTSTVQRIKREFNL